MRISVVHSTVYRYDSAVYQEPQTFRFRPRNDAGQRLLEFQLEISPVPAGQTECLDQDGNVILEARFRSAVEELLVRSSFQVETLRDNPFDYVLADSSMASLPLVYAEPWRSALAPYRIAGNSAALEQFVRSVSEKADRMTLPFLTDLTQALFEGFEHVTRNEGPPYAPETTLERRQGSCRDLAVLFCAACRTVGIPARFVSGYEREAAFQEQAYMHAWAEVYLQGGGWRGYDPSQGLAVSTSHVAVAAAANPLLAAPVSGSYRGSAGSRMQFSIAMQVDA